MTEEPKKDKDKISRAPIKATLPTGVGMEGDILPGVHNFPIEVTPDAGLHLGGRNEKDLMEGEAVNIVTYDGAGLGIVDRKYRVEKLPDGQLKLIPLGDPLGPQEVRNELARQIVKVNRVILREEITKAVEVALRRKDIPTLERLKEASDDGKKVKVTSQRGCMYLSIGRRSTIL